MQIRWSAADFDRLRKIVFPSSGHADHRAVLWVGAGLSIPAGYPSWQGLAELLRARSVVPLPQSGGTHLVDAFVSANGRGALADVLGDIFIHKRHLKLHEDLVRLPWRAIVTTNYDELLEDACKS